jgi:hypothetical protein
VIVRSHDPHFINYWISNTLATAARSITSVTRNFRDKAINKGSSLRGSNVPTEKILYVENILVEDLHLSNILLQKGSSSMSLQVLSSPKPPCLRTSLFHRLQIRMCVIKVQSWDMTISWTNRKPHLEHIHMSLIPITISQYYQFYWMICNTFTGTNSHQFALLCHLPCSKVGILRYEFREKDKLVNYNRPTFGWFLVTCQEWMLAKQDNGPVLDSYR